MNAQTILLILLGIALVFGLGVVFLNRRSSPNDGASGSAPRSVDEPRAAAPAPVPPTREETGTVVATPEPEPEPEKQPDRPSFRDRLGKTALAMAGVFGGVRARGGITADTWDDLEEVLLKADVGVGVTDALLDGLRARVKSKEIEDADALLAALQAEMSSRLEGADRALTFAEVAAGHVNVWLFVGVNGVGKTTTIGKVAAQQTAMGRTVVLAAGDTFRAAAAEQLGTWAERSGAELVRGNEGGDPSAVIFDGVQRAASRGFDLVLADTAGRLQNKSNLMDELRKVRRVAGREPGEVTEVLLVIDATTGQNGLAQAREFTEAAGVTGVVLSKLDGSAKGGIVFAIETELGIPVKLVGLGETISDLVPFDPNEFVAALFGS
ncbi:MAG: signal recognition particle-docking protein FtsY [Acidimicrobiia bacterium]|nr:signal recognition particle-docking protein FtsY [Acidimicrobiia bacterium]